ncbi:hypothetical protein NPIL_101801 [Nephila pilipes]|uniref:Uncharacterized protein n=1 Tax=Nephila pilipes TaxID=299642 RepID=A0A8X6PKV0_NEPPI|nr:hypothetical protein NPIL_101801 [Nephila pilipes]
MIPYKGQVLQNPSDMDKQKRFEFCADMQLGFINDYFADRLVFNDEVTFHISGKCPERKCSAPSFFHEQTGYLDEHLLDRWIGRAAQYNMPLTQRPLESLD